MELVINLLEQSCYKYVFKLIPDLLRQMMAKRILISEDDPDILEILEIVIQDEGFDIVSKRNRMSVDEVGLLHPDLILLNVRISRFEKIEAQLCAEPKEHTETGKIQIILLSAEAELAQIGDFASLTT